MTRAGRIGRLTGRLLVATLAVIGPATGCNDGGERAASGGTASGDTAVVARASDPCGTSTVAAHDHPEALLREWVRRDAEGELLRGGDWFAGALDCPGREAAAAPTFAIVARYDIDSVVVRDSAAAALVRWHRVGYVTGAGTNHASFDALPGVVTEVLRARRTPHGWRIVAPAPRGMLLYSALPVRQALGGPAHALVVQMAEQARRATGVVPGGG